MKKKVIIFASIITAILLFSFSISYYKNNSKEEKAYYIYIKKEVVSGSSIGNDWKEIYKIDNKVIRSGQKLEATEGEELVIEIYIEEQDKHPDIGQATATITVSNGAKVEKYMTIVEDKGRYEGVTAQIKVTITIEEK